jgi:hypothetical protein
MKLLITSIDAIIDITTGTYFKGIKESLKYFESLDKDNKVFVISIDKERLDDVPDDFSKLIIGRKHLRSSPELIRIISQRTKTNYNDIFILGAKDSDMILGANAKLILLTADYAKSNNPTERIYTGGYGIAIYEPKRLDFFFEHFLNLAEPWYYKLEIDERTTLYGLTNAMTRMETNPDVKAICEKLRGYLKSGLSKFRSPFLIYALVSVYQIFKEVEDINYWGYYPSSTGDENIELKTFKEVLRKSFKSSTKTEDILIRHTQSVARKTLSEMERVKNGCDSEFDSIIVNPIFKHLIKGKNVCIIDDFTNHGSSCETVRHLLQKAGVKKIIFISLGKFRTDYKMFDYSLDGNVFSSGYNYKRRGNYTSLTGVINRNYSDDLIHSLNHLVS